MTGPNALNFSRLLGPSANCHRIQTHFQICNIYKVFEKFKTLLFCIKTLLFCIKFTYNYSNRITVHCKQVLLLLIMLSNFTFHIHPPFSLVPDSRYHFKFHIRGGVAIYMMSMMF